MSKRGDAYLRTLLIHGARFAILAAKNKGDNTPGWLTNLLNRRHPNIAAVALANKNARTCGPYWLTEENLNPTINQHEWPHSLLQCTLTSTAA